MPAGPKNLYTPEAKKLWKELKSGYSEADLVRFGYTLASYANELAFYHKIEAEIATLESAVVSYTNNKNKTNYRKSELTRARKESLELLLKLAKALKLPPQSAGMTGNGGDDGGLELPP